MPAGREVCLLLGCSIVLCALHGFGPCAAVLAKLRLQHVLVAAAGLLGCWDDASYNYMQPFACSVHSKACMLTRLHRRGQRRAADQHHGGGRGQGDQRGGARGHGVQRGRAGHPGAGAGRVPHAAHVHRHGTRGQHQPAAACAGQAGARCPPAPACLQASSARACMGVPDDRQQCKAVELVHVRCRQGVAHWCASGDPGCEADVLRRCGRACRRAAACSCWAR